MGFIELIYELSHNFDDYLYSKGKKNTQQLPTQLIHGFLVFLKLSREPVQHLDKFNLGPEQNDCSKCNEKIRNLNLSVEKKLEQVFQEIMDLPRITTKDWFLVL